MTCWLRTIFSLNDLKALRETCNPQWLESGVRDLVSPTLTLFANEITHLANRHMKNADKVSQAVEAANQLTNREGFLPAVKISEPLEAAYKEHHSAHTELVDKESLDELTRWYASDEPVFPFKERWYRSAVVNQQRAVERLNSWYSTEMQVIE
ncbi:hypothetical protein M408DRAFT_138529 [Serendipita vermifera MAFF 305830]|uniref:Uncharacterized protein n=1 Tax=Serendipita vermifera MAFF 305830 TaxID=933852 RepID=A0A0C3A6X6_SERVB|nr:hypothetical protein M408DRAFT_138529 [Serendipita vermifera MAFF 305830]